MTQAVILVGGQGTRLLPLTCNTPKSMVPVLNVPFLEHTIRNLRAHGIRDIILAQHHLAAPMTQYFGDGSRLGVRLQYVVEDSPRGTAGAVKNVERYITGTTLVLNGDIFHNRDFTGILKFHRARRAQATIVLTPVEDPTIYGVVETDEKGRVRQFLEKPKREEVTTNMINAGTYVLEPEVLERVPSGVKYSFERELFPGLLRDSAPVYACPSLNYWMDTGTPEKYLQLHRDLLGGQCDGYTFTKEVNTGKDCLIHSAAQIGGMVIIGDNCTIERNARLTGPLVIGDGCIIEENAVLADSVIWDRVMMGARVHLQSSLVANDCSLGADSRLEGAVLGDHIAVSQGARIEPGARLFPPGHQPPA